MPGICRRTILQGTVAGFAPLAARAQSRGDVVDPGPGPAGAAEATEKTEIPAAAAEAAGRRAGATWRIATEYPATAIPGEGIAFFATALQRLGAGAIAVETLFDAPMGLRSATLPRALAEGRLQAADSFAGGLGQLDPIFLLSSLPFVTLGAQDAQRLYRLARPAYAAALAERGLSLLYATPWPPSGLWSRRPVPDGNALDGLRIRCFDSTSAEVFRAAGAAAETLSFADAAPRLQNGTLDAVLSSGDGGAGQRLWETLPHFTRIDYAWPLSLAYAATPAREAAKPSLVDQAAEETENRQWSAVEGRLATNFARMAQNGVTIHEASNSLMEALRMAASRPIADWQSSVGPRGADLLRAFRS
jgi:TRAP-type C4-dicarboxylate transport system substrate-binding protein